ncbi:MAG: ABC transporter ATP-binding protein [Desulfovermiculus sp.]
MNTIKKILSLLTPEERRRAYLLLFMILVMALLDTIGVASIMPFMSVLGNPEVVETNRWLNLVYTKLGFTSPKDFLFFLGLIVFIALVSSIAFKALTQYALLRFTHMRNFSLSCRLFKGYLGRPYAWFLNRHSADLGKSVLSEVQQVINNVVIPFMQLLAHGAVVLFLIILLLLVDPVLALVAALVLGGAYALIYLTIRRYLSRIGSDRVLANKERFQVAQEALGGIKEVKVFGREMPFFTRFVNPSRRFAKHQATNAILGQLPRYALEILAFGGVLILALFLFRTHGDFSKVLPLLAVYAFAGYRLLPALQQVYSLLSKLRFGLPALDCLYQDIQQFKDNSRVLNQEDHPPLVPEKSITLRDITFTYPGAHVPALKNLSLDIPARTTVGIVGSTGSGKTTTVDLILGLLPPDSGRLLVDGQRITQGPRTKEQELRNKDHFSSLKSQSLNLGPSSSSPDNLKLKTYNPLMSWQRTLGYVPQHIYLADDTVAANIAFGIPSEDIDMDAVIKAAQIAELHNFVTTELSKGYETLVGERGVRLSGGQRQRIGIARALYHDPAVLIFDEATSALDNLTEKAVMRAVHNLGKEKTVIMIAHRLSTVEKCDQIFLLEHGRLVTQGTYDQLLNSSTEFQRMAAVNE